MNTAGATASFALAIRGVAIHDGGWIETGRESLVAHIRPHSPGPRSTLARGERRHGCIVGVELGGSKHIALQCPDQRLEQTRRLINGLHMHLRKIIKTRGHVLSGEVATKLLWLAPRNILANKVRSTKDGTAAINQFAVMYVERFTGATT